jgi:cobalt-zinc-cadmium efflux system protein
LSGHAQSHERNGGRAHATVATETNQRRLLLALILIVAFMAGEVVAGILAHSLALLSDAAHMLTDAGAIGLSLVALRLAQRPAGGNLTFGLKRAEILSAQVTGARCSCSPPGSFSRQFNV